MNKEKLATLINGREMGDEITQAESNIAKEHGLVVIYGASDDLVEFEGAFREESYVIDGGKVKISKDLKILDDQELSEHKSFLKKFGLLDLVVSQFSNVIDVQWCPKELKDLRCSWLIKTDLPHASFDIMEEGDLFCRGIVIDVKDLK